MSTTFLLFFNFLFCIPDIFVYHKIAAIFMSIFFSLILCRLQDRTKPSYNEGNTVDPVKPAIGLSIKRKTVCIKLLAY